MKKILLPIIILTLLLSVGFIKDKPVEKKKDLISARVDSVLALMTLEEKVGQLNQLSYGSGWGPTVKVTVPDEYKAMIRDGKIGSFLNVMGAELTAELQRIATTESRLKIPLLFGLDVIHGFKTTFPVPLAEACSWDPDLVKKSAHYQSLEASSAGIHWTFTPMVDIARDPRWGRIVEGSGEDTYLGSLMAAARVKGYQGNLIPGKNIIACVKHYAAYGGAEGGRDYNTVDISERTLRDIYLPPFKASVDAGVRTVMASFNEIGGMPSSASKFLLEDVLRKQWGFNGFIVSDWNSIGELINHGLAADLKDAGRLSISAGLDMDMESRAYINNLEELVNEGIVDEKLIDESVKRILAIKFELGLFDNPFTYTDTEREKNTVLNDEIKNASMEVAKKSIVLLKNDGHPGFNGENQLLPLNKDIKKIAVIGPLANSKNEPLGAWSQQGDAEDVVTVLEGIKNFLQNNTEILYAEGCGIEEMSKEGFEEAVETASASDLVILCLGEKKDMSGEANSRSSLDLPGVQEELAKEIYKTGKPVVAVLMNGRPLSINWISENIPAILETWFLGTRTGDAVAEVLFGDYNPSGKLTVSFPRTVGQIPIYYNHKNTGRPGNPNSGFNSKYLDLPISPLYPFGYGLSYTKFEIGNPVTDKKSITSGEEINIKVSVKNIGNYDGEEVVQLYVRDLVGSVTRPVKELKGFKKIFLKKGEQKEINFTLTAEDLKFHNLNMDYVYEPGEFKIMVGSNSEDVKETSFVLK